MSANPFVFRFTLSDSGCWEWVGAYSSSGRYGSLSWNGSTWNAHRAAFAATKGDIPEGMHVCHKCDNTKCINPDHLFLGTQKENLADAAQKGRMRRGSENRSKLSAPVVLQIRSMRAEGVPVSVIARQFGLGTKCVYRAARRQTWAWLPDTVEAAA